jgi:chromosome segregation ATPase
MAATIGRLRAVLSANTTEFNQGFQRAKQSLNRFNGNMRFTRKQLKRFVEASSNTAQPLSASLKQANTVLKSTGVSLKHVDSALNKLSSAYENARTSQARFAIGAKMKELHTLKSSMMGTSGAVKSMKSSFGGANMAVVNFNRIIQDSPYGIIGVANNIEPLLLSLKGLKQSTGSAMGAFKLLIKSAFTGPGALITAFSLASTAAVFFAMKMRGAGSASKEAEEKIKATTSAIQELENVFDSLANFSLIEKAEQDLKQIDEAIKLANERNEVEEEYNKIKNSLVLLVKNDPRRAAYKKEIEAINLTIQRLGFEKTALEDLNKERALAVKKIDDLNNAQSEEAKIGKKIDEIRANVKSSIRDLNLGYDGSIAKIKALRSSLEKQYEVYRKLGKENKNYAILAEASRLEIQKLDKAIKNLNDTKKDSDNSKVDFNKMPLMGSIAYVEDQMNKVKEAIRLATLDEERDSLRERLAELQDQLNKMNASNAVNELDKIKKMISDSMEDTQKLIDGAKIDFTKTFKMGSIADVEDQMNKVKEAIRLATSDEERERLRQTYAGLQDQLNKMNASNFEENLDDLQSKMIDVGLAIQQAVGPAITSFAETLGDAFSGKFEGAEQFFGSLLMIVSDFMDQLGKSLIATAVAADQFKKIFKNVLKSNPAAAIAAGVALVAVAKVTKNLLSKGLGGGGKETSVNDALITSKGQVIKFHPNDNILAMKDFGKLGGIINQQPAALNNIGSPSLNNIRRMQPIYLESSINLDGRQIYKGIQLTKARINR